MRRDSPHDQDTRAIARRERETPRAARLVGDVSWRAFAGVLALTTLASCGGPSAPASDGDDDAIVQTKERGPVKVTLRVEPKEPTFADRIRYTLTTESEPGVEVVLPDPGEDLSSSGEHVDPSRFIIRDYQIAPRRTRPDGTVVQERSYVLEVATSGEFVIPATAVSFYRRDDGDAAGGAGDPEHGEEAAKPPSEANGGDDERAIAALKVLTDPIPITVKGLEDTAALEDLRSIEGPVEPPTVPPSLRWPLYGLGGAIAGALVVFICIKLARRPAKAPPPVPPEEIAYRELEWLLRQGLTERGELREFYFHLSRIVREYIERRFGLRAPERTTEEFLDELARSDALTADHKALLGRFLERADMVKFAKFAPEADEISASFDAAKEFISETRSAASRSAAPEASDGAR